MKHSNCAAYTDPFDVDVKATGETTAALKQNRTKDCCKVVFVIHFYGSITVVYKLA